MIFATMPSRPRPLQQRSPWRIWKPLFRPMLNAFWGKFGLTGWPNCIDIFQNYNTAIYRFYILMEWSPPLFPGLCWSSYSSIGKENGILSPWKLSPWFLEMLGPRQGSSSKFIWTNSDLLFTQQGFPWLFAKHVHFFWNFQIQKILFHVLRIELRSIWYRTYRSYGI